MVANRLYVQQGFQLKPSFQEVAAVKLFSGAESVDFTKANITAEMINKFVKEKTNERIKEIVKPDMFVDHHYRAVLINAISMKGTWVKPFPVIRKRNFYINETAFVERDFMMVSQYFWSIRMNELDARAIRLDYAKSNFSFVLILPNNRIGLHALESQLTNYTLSQIMDRMIYFKCIIHMPKFKIESSISLKEILKKMSMVSMFDRTANLSGLSDSEEPLYVDDIIHKTTIEIDEKHSETGRSIRTLEAAFSFEVYHPFIYHIWDRATNTTIFSGHIKNF
ncbi:alaserpin-like [Sitodiplosis mosellana]|uniref:alaserpin-like n=1 Tax=Sitodiplosis mosellana TaxID=263140 RepID=UPI0024450C57|nr:alaserpin-like [Sitodiplosis mosellana]